MGSPPRKTTKQKTQMKIYKKPHYKNTKWILWKKYICGRQVGRMEVCVYLGVTDAYLVLWKTLEKGMGWIVSCQEQLSIFSRREGAEE